MPYDAVIYQLNQPLFNLATSSTSETINIREISGFAVQPVATGSSVLGSIQLLASCDGTNFGAFGSAITLPAGNNIPVNFPAENMGYLQVQFTTASGVGSLTVNVSTKG